MKKNTTQNKTVDMQYMYIYYHFTFDDQCRNELILYITLLENAAFNFNKHALQLLY